MHTLRPLTSFVAGVASIAALGLLACSPSKPTSASPAADAGFVPLPPSPTTFGMDFTVPAGSEAFECTYVTMPAAAGFIVGGQHEYTIGSHHLTFYRTTLASIPAGEGSPVIGDCYAPTATYMNQVTGVVYASATPTGDLAMPQGVGLPYVASEVLLF